MALPSPAISTGVGNSSPKLTPGKPYLPMTNPNVARCTSSPPASCGGPRKEKLVWVWTEDKQVMTAAVERGWDTFLFDAGNKRLADDWRSISLIRPLFVDNLGIFDGENRRVGAIYQVSSPQQLEKLRPEEVETENLVVGFEGEWQVIPAENIVATFQGCEKTVFAIATTSSEAQIFFEALEQGIGGIILKAKDIEHILKLKDYLDRRSEVADLLSLTKATVKDVKVIGMGDRVCVDLCSLMQPGEGLLVGSFARGLFLVHSECLESNYIASRPFRVNAGPVHAYVAVPGGRTCYLSELKAGRHVIVADRSGLQRTVVVGRVKIESRQLILVEAEDDSESHTLHSIFLQNAETVGLVCPSEDNCRQTIIPVTSLKVGDKVLLKVQGGARHTGIEIQEFILEK